MAYELQKSFSAGEISPKMHLRNDGTWAKMHAEALSLCKNMIPTPHGVAESRVGSEFIEELVGEDYCRIFNMDVSFSKAFLVVVTPLFVYVLDRNGFKLGTDVLLNGDFSAGGVSWNETNVVFSLGVASLEPTGGQEAILWQSVTTLAPLEVHRLTLRGAGPDGANPYTVKIGTAQGLDDIFTQDDSGYDVSMDFTPGVSPFFFQVEVPSGGSNQVFDAITLQPSTDAGDIVSFVSPYTQKDILELHIDKEPGNKTMFLVTRGVAPHELTYSDDTGVDVWDFKEVVFIFKDDISPWGTDYPGCITFYAGRMALGGTYSDPIGIWLSKPRAYRDFDLGDPAAQLADDAIYLPLDKHGELVWLKGNKQLFAGLDTGEHVIYGEGGIIASNNAATEQHSTYGSARIQPQVVNEEIAYVDTRGTKVRLMDYNDDAKTMNSSDLSFIAEHITAGRIIEMKHGSSPLGAIYFPTAQGKLVSCYVEKDLNIYGWSQSDTQGEVLSVALLKEFGIDVPWVAVKRDGRIFIERFNPLTDFYMDSHTTRVELLPTVTFPDFDHLEGKTVQVLLDGAVHPDVVVGVGGIITTDYEGLECVAGLGFLPEIETIPEMLDTKEGSTRAHMKRYSEVDVHLQDSPRPIVNGQDTYRRSPVTPMDTREENHTEIVEITNVGWDNDAVINVQQPLPLKMTIAGVGGKLRSTKL